MDFHEMVRGAGELIGLDGFAPNEDNLCHLVAEDLTVTVEWLEEYGILLMSAAVCRMPPDHADNVAFLRALAAANFQYRQTGGSTISVDPESDYVYIFRYDRAFDWDSEDMLDAVKRVVLGVDRIRALISDFGTQIELPTAETPFLLGSGFILA